MKDLKFITTRLDYFDSYYEMSDSDRTYQDGRRSERQIENLLSELTESELIQVKNQTTIGDDMLNRYFAKFFENLPEPTPTPTKSKLSEIMSNAWAMFKNGLFGSFGKALKAAWMRFKLVQNLKNGIARFSFQKANGETRDAIGTLRNGNFHYEAKSTGTTGKPSLLKYFDIEANAWRSCRVERLITIAA